MLGSTFTWSDGEISIVLCKRNADGDILSTNVLVKLSDRLSVRLRLNRLEASTAGALASQPTHLLSLHVDIYKHIVGTYKQHLRAEVRLVLMSCPAFSNSAGTGYSSEGGDYEKLSFQ